MKKLLTALLVICTISGCAGISISRGPTRDEQAINGQTSLTLKNGSVIQLNQIPHPTDGTLVIESQTNWCGLTVWAIIPIPMLLPVCKSSTEVMYSQNVPMSRIRNEQQTYFAVCGPLLWMATHAESRKGGHFCESGTL